MVFVAVYIFAFLNVVLGLLCRIIDLVCAQYLIVGVRALYFANVVFACGALAAAFVGYFSVLSIALSL